MTRIVEAAVTYAHYDDIRARLCRGSSGQLL